MCYKLSLLVDAEFMRNAKKQLNTRVPEKKRDAVIQISTRLDYTRDEMVELALDALFGVEDEVSKAKRKKVLATAKEMSVVTSFNAPNGQHVGDMELAA